MIFYGKSDIQNLGFRCSIEKFIILKVNYFRLNLSLVSVEFKV